MAIQRLISTNEIVNRVAVEIGLTPVVDVFAVDDPVFKQLTYLLTTAAQELMEMYPWQILTREYQKVTVEGESGDLPLPDDFGYMIPQTGWERSSNVPLIGPLSAQDWTYLLGRDLVGSTIYASFRFDQGLLRIFPNDPMPAGLDINFEYISRNLFAEVEDPGTYSDDAVTATGLSQFSPNLITRLLKVKILEAKGFDSQKAQDGFLLALDSWTGKDNSAPILTAARTRSSYPYLDGYNVPATKYGAWNAP